MYNRRQQKTSKVQNMGCLPRSSLFGSGAQLSLLGRLRISKMVDSRLVHGFSHIIRLKTLPIDLEHSS